MIAGDCFALQNGLVFRWKKYVVSATRINFLESIFLFRYCQVAIKMSKEKSKSSSAASALKDLGVFINVGTKKHYRYFLKVT